MIGGDVNSALSRQRMSREELQGMQMAQMVLRGSVLLRRSGEFQTNVKFPHKFNGEPTITFGMKLGAKSPLVANAYPIWSAYVMRFHIREAEHLTSIVTGFAVAGFVESVVEDALAELQWIAVGEGFGGAS